MLYTKRTQRTASILDGQVEGNATKIAGRRNRNHHVVGEEPEVLYVTDSYAVARGLEQMVVSGPINAGKDVVVNLISPIGPLGKNREKYLKCALSFLGDHIGGLGR